MSDELHIINLEYYSISQVRELVDQQPKLALDQSVASKIQAGADYVQKLSLGSEYVYGVNTGFGSLCETRVSDDEINLLQYNHVVSHACGVGEVVSERISRFVLLNKLLTFRTGHTGVSLLVVNELIRLWNENVIPAIPKKGTVGASGDLAPLAHLALPLLNMGQVHYDNQLQDAAEVKNALDWQPVKLKAKEGLALTNGIQYIDGFAVNCLIEVEKMIETADVLSALSIQAFSASNTFYHPKYHSTSYHPERKVVAGNLTRLLDGSNHYDLPHCNKSKQDPYSFRCIPQVHGAVRQVFDNAWTIIERDINSVSDNPLFFPQDDLALYGGNLHGESTAVQMDCLAIGVSELASVSERRTYQLLSGQRGLPDFLVTSAGVNSGLMVPQYTSAALLNQNKVLCTPASVDTIPTCQLQEDHVSMGGTSAFKLDEIISNTKVIMAIEIMTAIQAIDLNEGLLLSSFTRRIVEDYRRHVSFLDKDRVMSDDINASVRFLEENMANWREILKNSTQPLV